MSTTPSGGNGEDQGDPSAVAGEIVSDGTDGPEQRWYDPLPRSQAQYAPSPQHPVQPYAPPQGQYGPRSANVYVVQAPRSVGVAFVLTFFFGVFGMFYSTVTGAVIMLGVSVAATIFGVIFSAITMGFGTLIVIPLLVLIWPVSIVWGCLAASSHNERLRVQAAQAAQAAQAVQYGHAPSYGHHPGY